MIRDLTELAALAAVGGALLLGACSGDGEDKTDDTAMPTTGCPTGGCPTTACPTTACPTTACPTTACPTTACPTTACPTTACPTSGFTADYATNADFFTLMAAPFAGTSPHGTVTIWYSTDLRAAIEAGTPFTAPVGATSIKEFDNGTAGIVVMTKQAAGYDAANGDWYYEMMDVDGNVLDSGAIGMCIGCHEAYPDTDYLGGTELR